MPTTAHTHKKSDFARKPVPPGTNSANLLLSNLCNHTMPNNLIFEDKLLW